MDCVNAGNHKGALASVARPFHFLRKREVPVGHPPTLDRRSSRERPPDVARHAATKTLAAVVDLNQWTRTGA